MALPIRLTEISNWLSVVARSARGVGLVNVAGKERLEFGLGTMHGAVLVVLGKEPVTDLLWEQTAYYLA